MPTAGTCTDTISDTAALQTEFTTSDIREDDIAKAVRELTPRVKTVAEAMAEAGTVKRSVQLRRKFVQGARTLNQACDVVVLATI